MRRRHSNPIPTRRPAGFAPAMGIARRPWAASPLRSGNSPPRFQGFPPINSRIPRIAFPSCIAHCPLGFLCVLSVGGTVVEVGCG